MSNDETPPTRLSRRDLLRIAGVSGLTVATGSFATPLSQSVLAMSAQDEAPEGFLAWAYAQRAQAMTAKDLKLLEAIYDPANADLVAFERERAAFMNDLGSLWDGQVLNYEATVSLIALELSGTKAAARIYETVRMQWIPTPGTVSLESLSQGSRGDITSVFGNRHEVKLVKGERGWRLAQDAYEEPHLYGASPDLAPGSWAAVWLGTPPNNPDTEVLELAEAMILCLAQWRLIPTIELLLKTMRSTTAAHTTQTTVISTVAVVIVLTSSRNAFFREASEKTGPGRPTMGFVGAERVRPTVRQMLARIPGQIISNCATGSSAAGEVRLNLVSQISRLVTLSTMIRATMAG